MIDWTAEQSDKFIGTTAAILGLIAAGTTAAGSAYAAHSASSGAENAAKMQTDAAKYGADKQDAAAQRAETFSRQQAENAWQNAQSTQRANYEQSKARNGSIAALGAQFGLPGMAMPDYVPGVDPHYDAGTSPLPGAPAAPGTVAGSTPQGQSAPVDGSAASISAFFKSKGVSDTETPYWVSKWPELVARGQQLNDPNYAMKRLSQADIFGGGTGAGTVNGAANRYLPYAGVTAAPLVAPNTPIPTPYQPGTIAGLPRTY